MDEDLLPESHGASYKRKESLLKGLFHEGKCHKDKEPDIDGGRFWAGYGIRIRPVQGRDKHAFNEEES